MELYKARTIAPHSEGLPQYNFARLEASQGGIYLVGNQFLSAVKAQTPARILNGALRPEALVFKHLAVPMVVHGFSFEAAKELEAGEQAAAEQAPAVSSGASTSEEPPSPDSWWGVVGLTDGGEQDNDPGGPSPPDPRGPTKTGEPDRFQLTVDRSGRMEDDYVYAHATIGLEGSASAAASSDLFAAKRDERFVIRLVDYAGFRPINSTTAEVFASSSGETPTIAFKLQPIPGAQAHRLEVAALQEGSILGIACLSDEHFLGNESVVTSMGPAARFDVFIDISRDGSLHAFSSGLEFVTDGHAPIESYAANSMRLIEMVEKLHSASSEGLSRADAEDELEVIGLEIAQALPAAILDYLARHAEPLTVVIRHVGDFDFPMEMAFLQSAERSGFLGELHRVVRLPDSIRGQSGGGTSMIVRRAASPRRSDRLKSAAGSLNAHDTFLRELLGDLFVGETLASFKENVLRTADFELIEVITHMRTTEGSVGLEFDGGVFRPGPLPESQQKFAEAAPMIILNACRTSQSTSGAVAVRSFVSVFLSLGVPCLVTTLIPVDASDAVRFSQSFFAELHRGAAAMEALRLARLSLGKGSTHDEPEVAEVRRRLSGLAYSIYCHPDLTVEFRPEGMLAAVGA